VTGKHRNWHRAWSRISLGRLRHESGAEFVITQGEGRTDAQVSAETLAVFQASEHARGVPAHDLVARLQRLCREAAKWHERNPE
jgi:hypothetical protein